MPKERKVGIFIDSKKKSGGAYQEFLYTLKNIHKYNNGVKFVVISASKELNINLNDESLEVKYFSLNAFERYVSYLRNFSPLIRKIKRYIFFKNKFENFLLNNNIDLVYFVGPSQYSLYLEDTNFFMNIPDISHRENFEFPEIVDSSEFRRKHDIFEKSLPRALSIITNCEIIKKRISFFYRILEEKIFIINHQPSNSITEFKKVDNTKQKEIRTKYNLPKNYIFYPAMYLPHKNHRTLLDSFKILKDKNLTNLKMVFCGNDIGYLKNLKDYAKNLNILSDISFLNFVEDEHLPYLYYDCSVLLMPSLIGPTNIPPWEAFKMQKPVIYSSLPGIKDVLKDSVLYVDPMSKTNIADAIEKILNDESLKKTLIDRGEKLLQESDSEKSFLKFFKIIENFRKYQSTWKF